MGLPDMLITQPWLQKKKTESSLFSEMSIVVDGLQHAPSNWAVA